MLANHERKYMKNRVGENPEVGTKVQVKPRGFLSGNVSVPKNEEIVDPPFEIGDENVAVKLDNPPTYATCRVVNRLFVSTIAP